MPKLGTRRKHHCPSFGCKDDGKFWCREHQRVCEKHQWSHLLTEACPICESEREAAAKAKAAKEKEAKERKKYGLNYDKVKAQQKARLDDLTPAVGGNKGGRKGGSGERSKKKGGGSG